MSNNSIRVLLVDDEPDFIKVATSRLKSEGFHVITESSGLKAFPIAKATHPDVIILDYMMPDMDGSQVLAQLKSDPGTKHIPVIMVTAIGSDEQIRESLEQGAVCHLTKPYNSGDLVTEIQHAIAKSRSNPG